MDWSGPTNIIWFYISSLGRNLIGMIIHRSTDIRAAPALLFKILNCISLGTAFNRYWYDPFAPLDTAFDKALSNITILSSRQQLLHPPFLKMAPTILIVGATGNTGRSVVATLSKLLKTSNTFSNYGVLALTRSSTSPAARQLAKLPGVEVAERNWVKITADWLREHEVVRVFIAPHNQPNQFAEESTFHVAALKAGVKYVVRISTTAANVRPDCEAYYPRSHWTIEAMLSAPEFHDLQWTSLQPNVFSQVYLSPAAEFIKQYRKTGKKDTLRLRASRDAPVGIIDPDDVGVIAAHLLLQEDPTVHNNARYVLNGPEDTSGYQIVKMIEQHIGTGWQCHL